MANDQAAVVQFLESSLAHEGTAVARIDTHTAFVFLAGARAWKLKRAVKLDYFDASTADRRKVLCEAEVTLNRRTAPGVYRGVVPVTREADGHLTLGGPGIPVDWLVEMNRFDQEALLDRMAANGRLDRALMPRLGEAIARFHATAERRFDHGGADGIRRVVAGNATGFAEFGAGVLDMALCWRVTNESLAALERCRKLLDDRKDAGFVRQCHGDLHLRNIVLIDGEPVLFDAIEFNDDLACIDVLYDLAFLLMDLRRRDLRSHANAVWNAYLRETRDYGGLAAMPLLLSCRAAVRAKTSATAAFVQQDVVRMRELQALAREYLSMAARLLHPPAARMIAIGGLSGTGKSTVALALAPRIGDAAGAVVLRSDEIRKELCGVRTTDRLGPEGYTTDVTRRVYATMAERASLVARGGQSVIVDAVFTSPEHRDAIERAAAAAGVRFDGFWLKASEPVLVSRVQARTNDASDADARVVALQSAQETGTIRWRCVDSTPPVEDVCREVERHLALPRRVLEHVAKLRRT